jgi:dolichol-phosphate mannosyltransferase
MVPKVMTRSQAHKSVLIVIPAYNEQGKIGNVVTKIPADLADLVLVVNDCSTDLTALEAESAGAMVINHEHNRGVGAAIRSGIDFSLENNFDIVAILSGDDQHDPSELYGVLKPILEDGYDFVQGSRRLGGLHAPNIHLFRRILTWFYTALFKIITGFNCTDATNGGRAFRTSIFQDNTINLWQDWLDTYQLEPYLLYMVIKRGLKVTEAPMKVIYHNIKE